MTKVLGKVDVRVANARGMLARAASRDTTLGRAFAQCVRHLPPLVCERLARSGRFVPRFQVR